MGDEIINGMSFAGADILCARAEGFSEPGRYRLAMDTANDIYRAMHALAPSHSPSSPISAGPMEVTAAMAPTNQELCDFLLKFAARCARRATIEPDSDVRSLWMADALMAEIAGRRLRATPSHGKAEPAPTFEGQKQGDG